MYVVIGAGLAGLSAALTLQNNGLPVTVLDSADRVGGRVASDLIEGFILDRGFQLINFNYPEIKRLNLGGDLSYEIAPRSIKVSIDKNQFSLADPRRNPFSLFSPKTGSLTSKLSVLRYLATTPRNGESAESHLLRCGTGDLYQIVLKPFLQGVFLANPSQVSAVVGREIIGSFITGKSGIPSDGVARLPRILGERIKDIRLNTRVDSISGNQIMIQDQVLNAKKIIIATDLTTAGQILGADEVTPLNSCTTWYHSTDISPTDSAELLVDGQQRGPVVNSIVISNLSRKYAPAGSHLISSTTITHASESEVRRHLQVMWGCPTEKWRFLAKYEINSALPLFKPGYSNLGTARWSDSIYRAGDYLTSPSQDGALLSGRLAAEELLFDESF